MTDSSQPVARADEDLLLIPKAERTQQQWDQLHDAWGDHMVSCQCQLCQEVPDYLKWIQRGGKVR